MPIKRRKELILFDYIRMRALQQEIIDNMLKDDNENQEIELVSVNIEIRKDIRDRAAIQAIQAGVGRELVYAKAIEYATADPHFLEWVIFSLNPNESEDESQ